MVKGNVSSAGPQTRRQAALVKGVVSSAGLWIHWFLEGVVSSAGPLIQHCSVKGEVSPSGPRIRRCMWVRCVFYVHVMICWQGVDGVGLKRRLADAERMEKESDEADIAQVVANEPASSSTSRRGGVLQRIQRELAEQASSQGGRDLDGDGPLWEYLIKKWARGKLTATEMQQEAAAAQRQGAIGMDRLAAIGKHGQHPQNAFRMLKSVLGLPKGAPEFRWFEIPTVHGSKTLHPFLLPHDFFGKYHAAQFKKWVSTITGPKGAALQFWEAMKATEFVRFHPDLPQGKWSHTVPIGMHGDGAAFSKQDSVYIFSWNSLLGTGTTVQKRFVTAIIRKSDMVPGTLDAIMKVLSWSFNTLLSGQTPSLGLLGEALDGGGLPLAGGWRGALCQVRGDWQFYCELFSFPQWNSADRMCWLCRASSTNEALAWVHFGPEAGWRRTRWTHAGYLRWLRRMGLAIPALLLLVIGFRLECIMIDILHTVDQGVASHIIANVMWTFAVRRKVFGASNQEVAVASLYSNMQRWFKETKERSKLKGKLTVERLRTKGQWPKLKAKAAATRHLARYALYLCETYGGADVEDRQMRALCQLLCEFYDIVQHESQFVSDSAKEALPKLGQRLVGIYTALATAAKEAKLKMWKLQPKLHLFLHLCEWQSVSHGNPRYYWTYADEDLAGLMAEIAKSVHPRTMCTSALFKWLWLSFGDE